MVRSQSHSASSTSYQAVELKPLAGSGGDDSKGSESTCQGDNETDEEDGAGPGGKYPRDGEGQDSESSDIESSDSSEVTDAVEPEEDHDEETKGTSSETEESDSKSNSSSLESDVEIPAHAVPPAKETKGDASMTETKTGNPNSSQMPSLPEVDDKDTGEEQKGQRCKDAQLLDKNFSEWHDPMISKGRAEWEKRDTMTCDHGDPCKELKYPDPAGPPLDYMKHHRVLKAKKTNEYNLCHFY